MAAASVAAVAPSSIDVPFRVGLVPTWGDGWTGRPGLQVSRDPAGPDGAVVAARTRSPRLTQRADAALRRVCRGRAVDRDRPGRRRGARRGARAARALARGRAVRAPRNREPRARPPRRDARRAGAAGAGACGGPARLQRRVGARATPAPPSARARCARPRRPARPRRARQRVPARSGHPRVRVPHGGGVGGARRVERRHRAVGRSVAARSLGAGRRRAPRARRDRPRAGRALRRPVVRRGLLGRGPGRHLRSRASVGAVVVDDRLARGP